MFDAAGDDRWVESRPFKVTGLHWHGRPTVLLDYQRERDRRTGGVPHLGFTYSLQSAMKLAAEIEAVARRMETAGSDAVIEITEEV